MKVLTAAEMREVDRLTSERYGIPSLQLMEPAGTRWADACHKSIDGITTKPRTIAVLCGKGNNGGDGFVAARHLQSVGTKVTVYLFSGPRDLHREAATNFQRWTATGNRVISIIEDTAWQTAWPEISKANVIVDAIFGTGFRGAVTGVIASAISAINHDSKNATAASPSLIWAVDPPSGLPSDGQPAEGPVLYAHKTVTFTAPKPGQLISSDSVTVGMLEVANIGSPPSLVEEIGRGPLRWVEPQERGQLPLVRTIDSQKGFDRHPSGSCGCAREIRRRHHGRLRRVACRSRPGYCCNAGSRAPHRCIRPSRDHDRAAYSNIRQHRRNAKSRAAAPCSHRGKQKRSRLRPRPGASSRNTGLHPQGRPANRDSPHLGRRWLKRLRRKRRCPAGSQNQIPRHHATPRRNGAIAKLVDKECAGRPRQDRTRRRTPLERSRHPQGLAHHHRRA